MDLETYELVTLPGGEVSIRSLRHGEVMHVGSGPRSEALALHIGPQRLAERALAFAAAGEPFVVWDVGLGAAANALVALEALRDAGATAELHSFEVSTALLAFALEHAGALGYLVGWEREVAALLQKGGGEVAPGLRWWLHRGDFAETLAHAPAPAAIFHDPYSPAQNPAMWSEEIFRAMRERTGPPPCLLTCYSRSTAVRVGLALAGWAVGVGEATGAKEETTLAATDAALLARPLGAEWLGRVRRSTAAAPLRGGVYQPGPISEEDWARLEQVIPLL